MDDQRQGVTPVQHAVLDFLDLNWTLWAKLVTIEEQIATAEIYTMRAKRKVSKQEQKRAAMEAAARLGDLSCHLLRQRAAVYVRHWDTDRRVRNACPVVAGR